MTTHSDGPEVRECWADAGGCRMRFLGGGVRSERAPVLLIHGLLGYSFSWRFNLPELARQTQVFAVDLPGVGFSERKPDLDCRLRTTAQRLYRFMHERCETEFDVVGTSHGGGVAIWLAALAHNNGEPRIRRLVLSAPVNPWSRHGRFITRVLGTSVGAAATRGCQPLLRRTHSWALRRMYGNPARISAGTLEGYSKPLEIPGTLDHVLRIVKCWHTDLADIESALQQISEVPTLLVWGGRDGAVLPQSAEKLQTNFRRAELVMFPSAGHLPYEEVPGDFNRAVIQFLSRD